MDLTAKITRINETIYRLYPRLEKCDICPRECRVNRLAGETGYCSTDKDIIIYTAFLHQGEEPGISINSGSGTIFFSGCNLKCLYCQNYQFSHLLKGERISEQGLAEIMLNLQKKGAANINLVTPTHFLPQILKALKIALIEGLSLPIIYNTSGYEKPEIIAQLAGIIDVYLADLRYSLEPLSKCLSNAPNYAIFARNSLKAMFTQVAPLWEEATFKKGLIIRILAIPGHTQEAKLSLTWIKENLPGVLVSLMSQYQPYFRAKEVPEINRPLNKAEYKELTDLVEELGLDGWSQDLTPDETLAGPHFQEGHIPPF